MEPTEISPATTPTPSRARRAFRWLGRSASGLLLVAAVAGGSGWLWLDRTILSTLPSDLSAYRDWRPPTNCRVHDANGTLIDEFWVERRIWVNLDTLPAPVWQAFIAAEDGRFFEHPGVDPAGIARALIANWQSGGVTQGASTLTQQLVKNLMVGKERSYERKIKEAVLALRLERELTKHQILELYINFVYLGAGNYGVEAAARDYFGVTAAELSIEQAALIAGLIPAPSRYNPRTSPDDARRQRDRVLSRMVDEGFLDPGEGVSLLAKTVETRGSRGSATDRPFPAYLSQVRREVRRIVGAETAFEAGLTVHTPLRPDVQAIVEAAVRKAVDLHDERQKLPPRASPNEIGRAQGAAVVLENATGRVVAISGGYEVGLEGFVRASQARRQPGSSFKPYVYAAALLGGRTQLDTVVDAPLSLPGGGGRAWSPKNYGGGYAGPMSLRRALASSTNTVAVRMALEAGPKRIAALAEAMGVRTKLRTDLTMALGSSEVTPLDQAVGYATIARLGVPVEPVYIDRLLDVDGKVIGERGGEILFRGRKLGELPGAPGPRALPAGVAYELLDMLREVVRGGTARKAYLPTKDRFGKTGTTNDFLDAWFVGGTPRYTIAVWIGSDTTATLGDKETGGKNALPVWMEIIAALDEPDGERFPVPDDAILVRREGQWLGLPRGHVPSGALLRPPNTYVLPDFSIASVANIPVPAPWVPPAKVAPVVEAPAEAPIGAPEPEPEPVEEVIEPEPMD